MVTSDNVLNRIKSKLSTPEQESRIRALYDRTQSAYEKNRSQGISSELQADWNQLKARFPKALAELKKETGL